MSNGVYYLTFSDGTPFGYYLFLSDPSYIYYFDLGYEYVFDGKSGVYFYDFASRPLLLHVAHVPAPVPVRTLA